MAHDFGFSAAAGRIAVHPDVVAKLTTQQLVDRYIQCFARPSPTGPTSIAVSTDNVHAPLCALKEASSPHVFKDAVDVQRILALDAFAHHLHQVIGARGSIYGFAVSYNVLVAVYLHEQAVPVADVSRI